MNKTFSGRLLSLSWLYLALCGGAVAASPKMTTETMGDNTIAITREATTVFNRDVDGLVTMVKADAAKYCADRGKQLKILDITKLKPHISLGYIKAKIVFKALNAGDPELTVPLVSPTQTTATGDLYNDLLKLDDLRKKGILTDAEFVSEKQKILNRSK